MDSMRPEEVAGVVDLLKRLRCHICCEPRSDLRRVLPVYERLLSPREDADISVQHELLQIRSKLLAAGDNADVVDVVEHMDRVVERCMSIEKQQQSAEATVPVEEAMRLLVALAGGEDGETFVLEDPMQVTSGKSSMLFVAEKKRVGDRIRMNDIELVQRSRALFQKPPVSLQEEAIFYQDLFNSLGNGIVSQHTALWCPSTNAEDSGLTDTVTIEQPTRFFSLPGTPPAQIGCNDGPKRQRYGPSPISDAKIFKTLEPGNQAKTLSPTKEVFFYDGTQELHCREQVNKTYWGEASSITENSSWGSESSLDISEPWIARTYAWEDLGDRMGLPEGYSRPLVRGEKRALRELVIPDDFACRNYIGEMPLEIHEVDLIEDSLRALSGVDSTIFRRDFQSATFQLPRKHRLKLRNSTVSMTASVLEVFRKSGTTLMRLEFLSIYYSQDPARGGKTLQAMGEALLLYLTAHRNLVETIAQQFRSSSYSEASQKDGIVSVTKLVCNTRQLCRVLETIGHIFGCDEVAFWPLLQQGKFPRGVALLSHLHYHVSSQRVEDGTGCFQELVTWFLVKSCSPLLAVLSDLISSGRVDEETDPFDEFEATMWSRNLLEKASAGGGDGLFSGDVSTKVTEMLPRFLGDIAPVIFHLSQVQALLRSVNAIASTHPLVNMQPLTMVLCGGDAVEHAVVWQSTIAEAMVCTVDDRCSEDAEIVSKKLTVASEIEPKLDPTRGKAKRSFQVQQRNMLDQQVLENKDRDRRLALQEKNSDARRVAEATKTRTDQEAYARTVLLNKYSVLLTGAEERHDYMKWRRDRAMRLPTAKKQLQQLHTNNLSEWISEMGIQSTEATACAGEVLIPANDGVRRASVKVNKEAGNRNSGIFTAPASTDLIYRKTGVRILSEPGGSGVEMYKTLYGGGSSELPTPREIFQPSAGGDAAAANSSGNVEVKDDSVVGPMDDSIARANLPTATEGEDVEMESKIYSGKESASSRTDQDETMSPEIHESTGVAPEAVKPIRVSLPPVHPFFSMSIPDEDSEVLVRALTETTSDTNFMPFKSIVDCCLGIPIRLVSQELEQVAVDWFRNSLQVLEHLRWLRKLMLMSEGLCMDIFARDFLRGLNSATRINWGIEERLSSALALAMIEGSVAVDAMTQNFHYKTTAALSQVLDSLTMTPAVPSLLSEIELAYDVKWPLGLVITSQSLDHYQQMHQFLLYVRLTSLELREVWGMLRTIHRRESISSAHERLCRGIIYKMQAFLGAFNETFVTKVLMTAWSDLELALHKAATLVELRRCHEEFVSVAIRCCLLDTPVLTIREAFLGTLTATWRLTGFVRALDRQTTGRAPEEKRVRLLCEEFDVALRALVVSLQCVTRDAKRSTREFSECLLLRLDFNQYYSTEDDPKAGTVAGGERGPGADDDAATEI